MGLSAPELAQILGVKKANLYKWEKGHHPHNPVDFLKVEKWLAEKIESVPRGKDAPSDSLAAQNGAISKNTDTDKPKNKLTTTTAKIDYGMKPTNGTNEHEAVIKDHIKAINTIADTSNSQQETISKLTDLVTKLIKK